MQWALLMLMLMLIRKSIEPSAEERLALGTVMVMMIIFDYHYDDNDYYYDDDDTYDHICGGTAYCLEAARASFIKFISFVADKITLYTRPSHSSNVNNKVTEAFLFSARQFLSRHSTVNFSCVPPSHPLSHQHQQPLQAHHQLRMNRRHQEQLHHRDNHFDTRNRMLRQFPSQQQQHEQEQGRQILHFCPLPPLAPFLHLDQQMHSKLTVLHRSKLPLRLRANAWRLQRVQRQVQGPHHRKWREQLQLQLWQPPDLLSLLSLNRTICHFHHYHHHH
jgi:hypothetical protein